MEIPTPIIIIHKENPTVIALCAAIAEGVQANPNWDNTIPADCFCEEGTTQTKFGFDTDFLSYLCNSLSFAAAHYQAPVQVEKLEQVRELVGLFDQIMGRAMVMDQMTWWGGIAKAEKSMAFYMMYGGAKEWQI